MALPPSSTVADEESINPPSLDGAIELPAPLLSSDGNQRYRHHPRPRAEW